MIPKKKPACARMPAITVTKGSVDGQKTSEALSISQGVRPPTGRKVHKKVTPT